MEAEKQKGDEAYLKVGEIITDDVTQVDPTTLATPSEQAPSELTVVTEEAGEVDKVRRAKVLYRFEAEDPGDLTLEPGQIVDVLWDKDDSRWRGRIGETEGFIPASYVEVLNDETASSNSTDQPAIQPKDPSRAGDFSAGVPAYAITSMGNNIGSCLIQFTDTALTVKFLHTNVTFSWPYNIIRKFKVYNYFSFVSGRRGPYGVAEYNFVMTEKALVLVKHTLTQITSTDFPNDEVSSEGTTVGEQDFIELLKDESRVFFEEAMKQGYVNVTLVKVIVEGPAGVGKTSVVYLLLGKPPPKDRHSTGCAERAIRVIRLGKEGEEWNEITTEEFEKMISEAVPVHLKAKEEGMKKLLEALEKHFEESEEEDEELNGDTCEENKEEESSAHDTDAVIDEVIKKLTRLVGGGKSSHRLQDMELIYLTDTGGQQPFWDLIPIFASDTSATLFVHRVCEKLDEHPLNDLYQTGKRVGPSQRATLTTAEAFKAMLRGLHEGEGKSSKMIAVGTHRDLADDCEETLEEKNKKFAAIASPHFEKDVVFRNDAMQEIIFPVNAKTPDDEKEARKIRASIEQGATQHKIPIWWFILQMILEALAHKLGRDVLSKDECVRISDTLGFVEGELDAALAFFDKLNIFLYKKSILPRVVFTNPQVPMGNLSRLVKKQYHLKAAEADPTKATCVAISGQWKNFRDCGILTPECLNEFKADYVDGIFNPTDFLTLLENLLVISQLSANEYFFPAILSMTTETKINACLMSSRTTKIAPLVVEFPTGWAPPGVYCCSVCHLQSHSGWKVVKKPPIKPRSRSSNAPPAQHHSISRNCIEFTKVGRPGSVTLVDNFSSFAVCVNIDTSKMEREDLAQHCQAIKTEIFAAVDAALENTHHKDTHPTSAFLCPRQEDASCSTKLHVAHLSSNGKQWICSANSGVFDYLTPDQTLWLSGTEPVVHSKTSHPKLSDLANRVAAIIPHKWKEVAIQLDLSKGERKAIESDEDKSFDRFVAVLEQWRQSAIVPYTWKTIVNVLKSASVDETRLAEELEKNFC
ncbi:hypothetical protein GBAR_LOCUS12377 [Geodia barretti]|uniref:SH3 domain-containing protein n=1 Tax=Geodia barretti TaxID=519541 RepID=A0AA35WGM2_GEOBA|nr:hypothetical protein GBAR_LOCUS12377 [Geodia barretti]